MAKVIRLDNMAATKVGSLIKSVQFDADTENGTLVEVGKLLAGEREIHEVDDFTAGSGKYVGIVCTPEIDKTKDDALITDFTNKAGEVGRVFILHKGDFYSIAGESAGADVDIDGDMKSVFQGVELASDGLSYNVYEVQ